MSNIFFDYKVFFAGGTAWNRGLNPNDAGDFTRTFLSLFPPSRQPLAGNYFYPPQGSALFGALAALPVQVGYRLLFAVNVVLLFVLLGMLGWVLSRYQPIGRLEIAFLASLLLTDFARLTIRNSQWGIILGVLLLGSFILARQGRHLLAGAMLALTSFKPSYPPIYLLYHLLRGPRRLLLAFILGAIVLTLAPLALTGRLNPATLQSLLDTAASTRHAGTGVDPLGNFYLTRTMLHLEVLISRLFGERSPAHAAVVWAVTAGLLAYAAYLLRRPGRFADDRLIDFALVSALSALLIYHRAYDLFLLFPGLLCVYVHARRQREPRGRLVWGGFLAGQLLLLTLGYRWINGLFYNNPALQQDVRWLLLLPLPWVTVCTAGATFLLKHRSLCAAAEGR